MRTNKVEQKGGVLEKVRELGSQALIYGFGNTLYKSVSFFLLPVYLKYLDPSQYGTIDVLLVTKGLTIIIVAMGLPNTVFRFYYRAKDNSEREKVVSTIFYLSLLLQLCVPSIILWKRSYISEFILKSAEFELLFGVLAVNIFLEAFRGIPLSVCRAKNKAIMYTIVNLSVTITTLLMNIYFVVFMRQGVLGVMLGNLCGGVVGLLMVAPILIKELGLLFDAHLARDILAFAVPVGLSTIPATIIFMADRYFLIHLTSLQDVGVYALGYKLGIILKVFLIMPFMLAWYPFVFSHEGTEHAKMLYSRMTTYFMIIVSATVVPISIFSIDIITILARKSDYLAANGVVPIIGYASLFYSSSIIFRTGINLSGKTYYTTINLIICLIVNLGMNFVMIRTFGYMGAAWTLLFTFLISTVLAYWFSSKVYRIDYDLKRIMCTIAVSIIPVSIAHNFPIKGTLGFFCRSILYLAYLSYLYFWVLSKRERERFGSLIVRKVFA